MDLVKVHQHLQVSVSQIRDDVPTDLQRLVVVPNHQHRVDLGHLPLVQLYRVLLQGRVLYVGWGCKPSLGAGGAMGGVVGPARGRFK